MFDSINDKLSDRNFIQSAIDTASKIDGPFNRTNSPFEKFRMRSSKSRTFKSSSSSSFSSSSSSSSSSFSSSSSSMSNADEIDTPSHANPAPSTEPPDLFKSEFEEEEEDGAGASDDESPDAGEEAPEGGKAAAPKAGKAGKKKGKRPNPSGLHKKHAKVVLRGGRGTGKKPSFDFGPPKPKNDTLPEIMTPREEMCYSNRYSDLGDMTPIEHYLEVGQEQSRQYQCGNFMTWMMAARYLDRYWEIGDKFGRNGKSSVKMAREHWYNNGSMQSPKLSMAPNYP